MSVVVPAYAKAAARRALSNRLSFQRPPGLSVAVADRLGIASGVARARQLVRSKTISAVDARRVAAFYSRFKNCRTPRCEVAIGLWGGRRFGRKLAE